MELKNKKINFLGDSITEGVGASCRENIYLNVMARECELAAARNYGISCTRIARQDGEGFYGNPFCDRYMKMDDDADIIVIFGGVNDFLHGRAPFGAFDDRTKDTYYGAWHVLLRGLLEKYPDGQIVVMTPLHRTEENVPSPGNGRPLKDYVAAAKEVAEFYSVPVLDLFAESGIQPEVSVIKEKYCPDGLHPSDAGNRRIAERLAGFLKSL